MGSSQFTERIFTQLDYVRLTRLITASGVSSTIAKAMEAVLWDGDVVPPPEVPPHVVTMYSQVMVQEGNDPPRKLTLCYPGDAEPVTGFISVLSPVGIALLGLQIGQTATWEVPGAGERSAKILEMLFQPEKTGDYTT